jgi:hypothetical protein
MTSSTMTTASNPLLKSIAYSATGNITSRSDVGTYTYPAAGQPRPHGV